MVLRTLKEELDRLFGVADALRTRSEDNAKAITDLKVRIELAVKALDESRASQKAADDDTKREIQKVRDELAALLDEEGAVGRLSQRVSSIHVEVAVITAVAGVLGALAMLALQAFVAWVNG